MLDFKSLLLNDMPSFSWLKPAIGTVTRNPKLKHEVNFIPESMLQRRESGQAQPNMLLLLKGLAL
ncbi:MAG: hypothetical protein J0L94_07985 [Rhodothermia bacterium]|nr:hypothetical protein [Rhodothermia bacterium]